MSGSTNLAQSCGRARIAGLCLAFMLVAIIIIAISATYTSSTPEPLSISMTRLRRDLFKDYDKLLRPIYGPQKPVDLAFGLSLINMDMEKDGTVILDTWVRSTWKDFRLKWDASAYGNISVLRIPSNQIWTPDVTLYNEKGLGENYSNKNLLGRSDVNALIYSDGEVLYIPPVTMKSFCLNGSSHGLQKDWPWGEHMCLFKFGSWTYDGFQVNITAYKNKEFVDISDFVKGPVKIVNNMVTYNVDHYSCCEEPYPSLSVNLTLQKLYKIKDSGMITNNPFIDVGELSNQNYSKWFVDNDDE